MEECSSLMQNLMQIHFSTHSVILNVTPTIFTCSLCGVYRPHPLVQWSRHCSRMHIPVYSSWLSGYISVVKTILIILTIAGLFHFPGKWNKQTEKKGLLQTRRFFAKQGKQHNKKTTYWKWEDSLQWCIWLAVNIQNLLRTYTTHQKKPQTI